MEVYIDDMMVKSSYAKEHTEQLCKAILITERYNMKLNPAKCSCGVTSRKFLGYLVSYRGIQVDLMQIKAIENIKFPTSAKEVQKLIGRLVVLSD